MNTKQVHVLPREMFGCSTFGIATALLKWFPLRLVDKLLLLVSNLTVGNTDQLGLRRPKTGPIELKNITGKTPVLDVGGLSQIKSGKIKVNTHVLDCYTIAYQSDCFDCTSGHQQSSLD